METKIQIQKRDGSLEDFQPQKIERVVQAAGLTEEQAKTLSKNVSDWIYSLNPDHPTTKQIRDKVVEELEKVKPYSAGLYKWYEKTKDNQPALSKSPA